jgi:hypothetical protein
MASVMSPGNYFNFVSFRTELSIFVHRFVCLHSVAFTAVPHATRDKATQQYLRLLPEVTLQSAWSAVVLPFSTLHCAAIRQAAA